MTLSWSACTDVGKRRTVNEDSVAVLPGLFVVADGMGGHAAGDVASRLAIETVERFSHQVPLSFDQLEQLVAEANNAVRQHALSVGPDGMGTTLVGVALVENGAEASLVVFNVGDSRCYALGDEGLRLVTADHSLVQEMVDAGSISPADADRHPERNVVTRAIGIEGHVAADFVVLERGGPTRLFLCSDGVSGELDFDELAALVGAAGTPDAVARDVIAEVLDRPARDNATVVVIDVEWSERHATVQADVTGPRRARSSDFEITVPRPNRPMVGPEQIGPGGKAVIAAAPGVSDSPAVRSGSPPRPPLIEGVPSVDDSPTANAETIEDASEHEAKK